MHFKISVDDEETVLSDLRSANIQDSNDCVKRLLCELQARYENGEKLTWDEELILSYISPNIDYNSPIIQFHLAAHLGSMNPQNPEQCRIVYSRSDLKGPIKRLKIQPFIFISDVSSTLTN